MALRSSVSCLPVMVQRLPSCEIGRGCEWSGLGMLNAKWGPRPGLPSMERSEACREAGIGTRGLGYTSKKCASPPEIKLGREWMPVLHNSPHLHNRQYSTSFHLIDTRAEIRCRQIDGAAVGDGCQFTRLPRLNNRFSRISLRWLYMIGGSRNARREVGRTPTMRPFAIARACSTLPILGVLAPDRSRWSQPTSRGRLPESS